MPDGRVYVVRDHHEGQPKQDTVAGAEGEKEGIKDKAHNLKEKVKLKAAEIKEGHRDEPLEEREGMPPKDREFAEGSKKEHAKDKARDLKEEAKGKAHEAKEHHDERQFDQHAPKRHDEHLDAGSKVYLVDGRPTTQPSHT